MIYTRFGSAVKVTGFNEHSQDLTVEYTDPDRHGKELTAHISQFKADDGLREIQTAIFKLPR